MIFSLISLLFGYIKENQMNKNVNLHSAKQAKKDEFYTQLVDIEKEMESYLAYNKNVFRGKTLLLPCDDPTVSNFTRYFITHFEELGLKKLISTSYAPQEEQQEEGGLFHESSLQDTHADVPHGKIFVLEDDNAIIDVDDVPLEYLEGDGDFRSNEITALRDEADMVITNPPFSLFREFIAWLIAGDVEFSIIGNMNAITYKETFSLIQENSLWLGASIISGDREFEVPDSYPLTAAGVRVDDDGKRYIRVKGVRWFTNIQHGKRNVALPLTTMDDNMQNNKKIMKNAKSYMKYDNYDAIEVPVTAGIPSDYTGIMGVPISFLDKYCPEQFEILGITDRQNTSGLRTKKYTIEDSVKYNDLNARSVVYVDGEYQSTYARILIRPL